MTGKTYKPKSGSSVEVLVAGAGVAGLLVAAFELQKGKSVHLTEKLSKAGGRFSPELREGFYFGSGFSFGNADAWKKVSQKLGLDTPFIPVNEGGALVHGPKGWGHSEKIPAWESYWSRASEEFPAGGLGQWVEKILGFCQSFANFSYSLECPVTSLEVNEGNVTKAILGAEVEIQTGQVFWCADYKSLLDGFTGQVPAVGPERVSWLKKFVKSPAHPGVVLEFAHKKPFAEFTETLLLPFAVGEKEARHFVVGSIVSNRDPSLCPEGSAYSSWILPLTEAEWGDNHESMKKIRSGRRALEKAFPEFEKNLRFERVLALSDTISPLAKKKGDWQPLLPNLTLAADWAMPGGATFESLVDTLLS